MYAVYNAIENMNHEELNKAVRAINERRKNLEANARKSFAVGDAVWFVGKRGTIVNGKIVKVNQKTIGVATNYGEKWRVSPSLLKHCKAPCQDYIN